MHPVTFNNYLSVSVLAILLGALASETNAQETEAVPASKEALNLLLYGKEGSADKLKVATAMPTDAAAAILSLDQNAVTHVNTLEDLGVKVFPLINSDGSITGVGSFSMQPYWFFDSDISIDNYAAKGAFPALRRVFARTSFSIAIANGFSSPSGDMMETPAPDDGEQMMAMADMDREDFRASFGFITELLDQADPRFNNELKSCLATGLDAYIGRVRTEITGPARIEAVKALLLDESVNKLFDSRFFRRTVDQALADDFFNTHVSPRKNKTIREKFEGYQKVAEEEIRQNLGQSFSQRLEANRDQCTAEGEKYLQKQRSLRVGAAIAGVSDSGSLGNFDFAGGSVWTTFRQPFASSEGGADNSFGVFGRYSWDTIEEVITNNEAMPSIITKTDRARVGLVVSRVTDNLSLNGTVAYVSNTYNSDLVEDEEYVNATLTASLAVRNGAWIELGLGWSDSETFEDDEFVKLGLKVDLAKYLGGD